MNFTAIVTMLMGIALGNTSTVEFVASVGENIDGLSLNNPQCLAVNLIQEEFLVADALNDRVVIFDTTGAVVHSFSLGDDRHNPFGIAADPRGEILVGAMDSPELWLFDYNGSYLGSIALPDSVLPGRLQFFRDNEILVVDRAGRGILRIDESGIVLGSLVANDIGCKPSSVFIDKAGNIVMVSFGGTAITGFGSDGRIVYSRGEHGRRPEDYSHPTAAVEDNEDRLWIIDSFRHHIKRFDSQGNFIDVFGERGVGAGEFFFPVDIQLTHSGKLAILDKGSGRLQIFRLGKGEDKR